MAEPITGVLPVENPFLSKDPPHVTCGTYEVNDCRTAVVQLKEAHRETLNAFEALWYHGPYTWATTQYRGHCLMKFPTDLWAYQELIYHLQPDLIIETATAFPGNTGKIPQNVTPVAETLRMNGYATGAFGKWHELAAWEATMAGPFDRWPTRQGFDKFYGFLGGETNQSRERARRPRR